MSRVTPKINSKAKPAIVPTLPLADIAVEAPATETPVTDALAAPAAEIVVKVPKVESERHKITRAIGVHTSAARVRKQLDKSGINKPINDTIKLLKADSEKEGADVGDLKQRIAALSRERMRFSSEAPFIVSTVVDETLKQLISFSMSNALAEVPKMAKMVYPHNVHGAGIETLSLYPLFSSLPSFVAMADSVRAETTAVDAKKADDLLRKTLLKEFCTTHKIKIPRKKKEVPIVPAVVAATDAPAVVPEVAVEVPVADAPADELATPGVVEPKSSFIFYVKQVSAAVKADKATPQFATVRMSARVNKYLGDLVVELLSRLGSLIQITTDAMKIKTVNDVAILKTIEKLLIDGRTLNETFTYAKIKVVDPVIYDAELKKRADAKLQNIILKIDMLSLPMIDGYDVTRHISYVNSGFEALNATIDAKLALYRKYNDPAPVPAAVLETAS